MDVQKVKDAAWLVHEIEVGLRDFLIDIFDSYYSQTDWYSNPQDSNPFTKEMLEYLKPLIKDSSAINPLYFITLGHLKRVFDRKQNKEAIVTKLELKQKKIISDQIELLQPIRNKVAHSHYLSDKEFKHLRFIHSSISAFIPLKENTEKKILNSQTITEIILEIELMIDGEAIPKVSFNANDFSSIVEKCLSKYKNYQTEYYKIQCSEGSKLSILKWVKDNKNSLNSIKEIIQ